MTPAGAGRRRRIAPLDVRLWRSLAVAVATALGLCLAGSARAEPAACAVTQPDVKQDCLTAAAVPKPGDDAIKPVDLDAPVNAPLSPDRFQPVAVDALVADPAKFLNKPIAVPAAQCFYFGVGDYRCVLDGPKTAVISTAILIPPQEEVAVEHGCGDAGPPPGCSHRVMFVPTAAKDAQADGRSVVLLRSGNVVLGPRDGDRQTTAPKQ